MIFSIYRITNLVNRMVYIGFTSKDPNIRWYQHQNAAKSPDKRGHHYLHRAIHKYGADNFAFDVIYQSKDKVYTHNEMEPRFIAEYDSLNSGYNLTRGGEAGMLGLYFTEEHKANISASLKGRPNTHMQIVNRNPEKIRKTAEKHRGMKRSDETKAKIGAIHKGKTISEEQKLKLSKKWIVIFPDGHEETVMNLNAFCKERGLDVGNLSNVAYGRAKSHKGFSCRK